MKKLQSVLVATDFLDGSSAAMAQGLRLASWHRAAVRAVHVIDIIVGLEPEPQLAAMQLALQDGMVEEAKKDWATFAGRHPGAAGVTCEILLDSRVRGILEEAGRRGADLLVLGAAPSGPADTGFGSVTTACVRHSPCDVLIARQNHTGPFKNIMACVDFSPASLEAVEDAVTVATQDSARLEIVHAFNAPWSMRRVRDLALVKDDAFQKSYVHSLEQKLADFLKPLEHELNHLKASRFIFATENYRTGILEHARNMKADLVVLGTRGKTTLRDVFLGSTAEKVLGEVPCSVLAIRPGR